MRDKAEADSVEGSERQARGRNLQMKVETGCCEVQAHSGAGCVRRCLLRLESAAIPQPSERAVQALSLKSLPFRRRSRELEPNQSQLHTEIA